MREGRIENSIGVRIRTGDNCVGKGAIDEVEVFEWEIQAIFEAAEDAKCQRAPIAFERPSFPIALDGDHIAVSSSLVSVPPIPAPAIGPNPSLSDPSHFPLSIGLTSTRRPDLSVPTGEARPARPRPLAPQIRRHSMSQGRSRVRKSPSGAFSRSSGLPPRRSAECACNKPVSSITDRPDLWALGPRSTCPGANARCLR